MKKTERDDRKRCYMIPFASRMRALLLAEIAQSRGFECWIDDGNRYEVCIYASEEEIDSTVRKAADTDDLLRLKQLEALSATIESIGEKPSRLLKTAISAAKREAAREESKCEKLPAKRFGRDSLASSN
ncbi:MAG: hypothetical protein JXC85_04480 [Candidatus Aenigmarchaeota archaeon]|nr:hypothetical protein [Candidatus Aenigmarchaeota archaeon]